MKQKIDTQNNDENRKQIRKIIMKIENRYAK